VKIQTKLSSLGVAVLVTATGLAMAPSTATAGTADLFARPGHPGQPKVVRLKSNDHKVNMSDRHFRPGVTEFRVTKTVHRGSSLVILETDNLARTFKKFGKATSGGPGSADAMKTVDRIATFYGGGAKGARWQVKLSAGSYYFVDTKTNKLTTFTVKGDRRGVKMAHADSEVWATKQNQFQTDGKLSGNWVSFTNKAHEIHFLEADHVAGYTTPKDVRRALKSHKEPKFDRSGGFFFDVQSPGVKTVHRQDVASEKYLLMCWMPSEEQDGTPHALMGMWHLVWGS